MNAIFLSFGLFFLLPNPLLANDTVALSALIPDEIDGKDDLIAAALKHNLQNVFFVDKGIAGKANNAIVFVGSTKEIPDWDRLYWTMVRILSERYGCFMKVVHKRNDLTRFDCRDQRRVVFRRGRTQELIYFNARQYDRNGNEIVVNNHQIQEIIPRG